MARANTPPTKSPAVAPVAPVLVEHPGRTRIQIDVTPDVLELLDVVAGVTGSTRTGLVLEALMVALPGFVDRAETFVLAAAKITSIKDRRIKR